MKFFVVAFLISCLGCAVMSSLVINCEFKEDTWRILGMHYQCYVNQKGNFITDRSNRNITNVTGTHFAINSIAKVKSIWMNRNPNTVWYFPLGLETIFPILEGIHICYAHLKEIRQGDLKELTKLRFLNLHNNEIQYLETNLFDFNPKLEFIDLNSNKIAHIGAHLFKKIIGKLKMLNLSGNVCKFEEASQKLKIDRVISEIQNESCKNESIVPVTTKPVIPTECKCEDLKELVEELKGHILEMNADMIKVKPQTKKRSCCGCDDLEDRIILLEEALETDQTLNFNF